MKILVASHTYIVNLNCEKLRSLSKLAPDIEVTVVVPKRWKPGGVQKKIIEPQNYEEDSFSIVPITNFSQNHQGLLTFGTDLIRLIRKFNPDIIQVEQGSRGLAYTEMITLNNLLGIKAKNIFFTWWNLPYQLNLLASLLEKYNLKHSHGIISGNQDGAEILRQHGYQGLMKVMPQLGVDDKLFKPNPQPELKQKLGITDEDFIIGFVGRFVQEKGILTLLKSLISIKDKPWKLLLLGRGELKSEIISRAKENNIQDRIILVESVPHHEVCNYINLMNALVLPSETTYKFKTLTSFTLREINF